MKAHWLAGVVLATVVGAMLPVAAHHSFSAEFDANRPLKLKGTLTEMKWVNPHSWIYIDVAGKDGKPERWAWETTGVNILYRQGWRKQDLKVGTVLVIEGPPGEKRRAGRQRLDDHVRGWPAPVRRRARAEPRQEVTRRVTRCI